MGQREFFIIALNQWLESGNVPFVEGASRSTKSVTMDDKVYEKNQTTSVSFDTAFYYRDSERMARAAALFIASFAKERGTVAPDSTNKPIN